ncbi:uncharacterized protein LOC115232777 [Formica exsecta]|uniref:uncharacterized protein LOC115232777 n=1 Tax=Formica exsecta TaxID=72781 RepID=UPI0011430336|nr:uncharacterized protein LOC115232777 [Formica exsecta]
MNNPDKESSCSSQNSSHSLVQTITSSASFEGRFSSPNSVADQNKTHSIFDKVGEEETKLQEEPRYFCDFECKHCDSEIKLSSTILLEISKKLDLVLINQVIIVRSVNPDHAKSIIPCNFPPISLKTKKDFQKMEMFLAANRINYEAMRDLLHSECASAFGTSSIPSERSVTGNILSKLISNNLAKLISWSGSEGDKIKFSDTKLCEVVFGTVKLRFPNSFLTDAEAKIKRWFQTANGREVNESHNSDT